MNSPQPASAPLVQIEDLCVTFTGGKLPVQAVSGVTLNVARGQVMALIGESGSGKSVTLRTLLRLHPERRTQMRGKVLVDGRDVLALSPRELNDYRGKTTSMIFQEPLLALDPVYPLGQQIVEAIRRHEPVSRAEAERRGVEPLEIRKKGRGFVKTNLIEPCHSLYLLVLHSVSSFGSVEVWED
jgi:peptide/nickel transport system ATP-binding protein